MLIEPAEPTRAASRADPVDRLVELLDLPRTDTEARDLAGLLLSALDSSRQTGQWELLDDAMRFVQGRLVVHGLDLADFSEISAALQSSALPPLAAGERLRLEGIVEACADPLTSAPPAAPPLRPEGAAYVEHLLQGDRHGAVTLMRRCVTDGMDIYEILLDLLEPAQREVGRLWALGAISVAQEHFCTAVTQFVMTDLYPGLFDGEVSQRRLLGIHVPGALHHVGLRMVLDVLECRGWSTTYLVDDVTAETLPGLLVEEQADLLLISAAMPSDISQVKDMIRAVRQDPRTRDVRVVVGGRPFSVAPDLADAVGADGWARDARSAVDVCNGLLGGDHAA